MAIEIFYLTSQIHRWVNVRVADHLAAQADRLARRSGKTTSTISFNAGGAEASGFGLGETGMADLSGSADAGPACAAAQTAMPERENHMVHA